MNRITSSAVRIALLVTLTFVAAASLSLVSAQGTLDSRMLSSLTFRTIGPANMSGRIVDVAVVEHDPYTFYVASSTGGLWKTSTNGVTFTPVFQHEPVHSIGCVTVAQSNPDIVWVGSGEATNRQSVSWGDGVYKSIDAGRTWTNMGLRDSKHVARIVLHPANPDIVFVAVPGHLWGPNKERGLFKSADGGRTWTNVLFVDEDTGATDVAIDPVMPDVIYAAMYQRRRQPFGFHGGGPGSALYKSSDGGRTWTKLTAGLPEGDKGRIGISIHRRDPRIVYASIEQGLRYNASTAYGTRLAGIYRSDDRGESWQHMSDWNPRPMYASQIRVDPSDPQRVYMMNSFSFSDDGGRTFTTPRQSLHGDDRVVWVNPRDSRHLIKGDDGGVGMSYDRGLTWLYVASLPLSQFYRVSVDMRQPFWVYGGLQDNGSWAGPSGTYETWGVLNEDWVRTGGGDGFFNVIDPTDNRTLYTNSQYLGLTRFDMVTREARNIRPGDPRGAIGARRNWETWGRADAPEPLLGNAMEPANWDAPLIISPHDHRTVYAGTRRLWKSTDRGESWVALIDPTTGVDRSTLAIMGRPPDERTLSLDDGIPYYPTVSALAESPRRRGLLYVGTDDGNLQVSHDGGSTWTLVSKGIPGLPAGSWVAGLEASRHADLRVYACFDNHRRNDYRNYVYRSNDAGRTWASITGDLPADRVVRTVREDPRNGDLLYAATEFGLFLSPDGGQHWIEMKNNLPRVAINDLVVHPRDNDLVLATHSRGIWILDNLASIQELTPSTVASDAHLFTIEPAQMIRYSNSKAHAGDMIFRGENPPAGAIIDYSLQEGGRTDVTLEVIDTEGRVITSLRPTTGRGINRVVWDLRHRSFGGEEQTAGGERRTGAGLPGPLVVPGPYTVRLQTGGRSWEQRVEVSEDPRIEVNASDRRAWTDALFSIGNLHVAASRLAEAARRASAGGGQTASAESLELQRVTQELQSRIASLYRAVAASTGPLTPDQRSQMVYFDGLLKELQGRIQ